MTVNVCTRCFSESEYRADEKVWRHKDTPREKYFQHTFCDRYGYPIEIKPVIACATCEGHGGTPDNLCGICKGTGYVDAGEAIEAGL